MGNQEFLELLALGSPQLSESTRIRISQFRDLVVQENETQNLTRLLSPKDFYEGHVLDAIEVLKSGLISYPAMDLGSGAGVPGLICALIDPQPWILCDSESSKAAFLERAARELGLSSSIVQVFSGRAEDYLKQASVQSVVSRAVGPVVRIYNWLRPCSTWNNLVLMKGPGWEREFADFAQSQRRKELVVTHTYAYSVGEEQKKRVVVRLQRS